MRALRMCVLMCAKGVSVRACVRDVRVLCASVVCVRCVRALRVRVRRHRLDLHRLVAASLLCG